jgi:hypothetical protein
LPLPALEAAEGADIVWQQCEGYLDAYITQEWHGVSLHNRVGRGADLRQRAKSAPHAPRPRAALP